MLIMNYRFIIDVLFFLPQCTQVELSLITNDAQAPGTAWKRTNSYNERGKPNHVRLGSSHIVFLYFHFLFN